MAMYTQALERKAVHIAFSRCGARLAVLSDQDITVFNLNVNEPPYKQPIMLWQDAAFKNHNPRQVAFIGDDLICVLTDTWDEVESWLWWYVDGVLMSHGKIVESGRVNLFNANVDCGTLYIQLQNGEVHRVIMNKHTTDLPVQTTLLHKFQLLVAELHVIEREGQVGTSNFRAYKQLKLADASFWLVEERLFARQ